jgi:hypothetical protein
LVVEVVQLMSCWPWKGCPPTTILLDRIPKLGAIWTVARLFSLMPQLKLKKIHLKIKQWNRYICRQQSPHSLAPFREQQARPLTKNWPTWFNFRNSQ